MSLINENDFQAVLELMNALDCFIFFNGGPDAGASQEHKHLQGIPYSSFGGNIPLDTLIKENEKKGETIGEVEYSKVEAFQFLHILCKFKSSITKGLKNENIRVRAKMLENVYMECLKRLNNTTLSIAYNFVLTKDWLFFVLRKCETGMGKIKINSLGFVGSFAVRSETEYEFDEV